MQSTVVPPHFGETSMRLSAAICLMAASIHMNVSRGLPMGVLSLCATQKSAACHSTQYSNSPLWWIIWWIENFVIINKPQQATLYIRLEVGEWFCRKKDKHPMRQIYESTFPQNILFHKVGVTVKLMPVHKVENFVPTPLEAFREAVFFAICTWFIHK